MSHQADKELSDAMLDTLVARERHGVAPPPLTEWPTLAAQLREEGLIPLSGTSFERTAAWSSRTGMPLRRHIPIAQWGVRIAASVALLGAGVVLGRGWTGGNEIARYGRADVQHVGRAHGGATAPSPAVTGATPPTVNAAAVSTVAAATSPEFHSPAEARRVMTLAAADYQRATAYLVVLRTAEPDTKPLGQYQMVQFQMRVAGLDQVLSATQQALAQAPHDPVLKQYYASTVGARQAALQQLSQSLPTGEQLTSY